MDCLLVVTQYADGLRLDLDQIEEIDFCFVNVESHRLLSNILFIVRPIQHGVVSLQWPAVLLRNHLTSHHFIDLHKWYSYCCSIGCIGCIQTADKQRYTRGSSKFCKLDS